MHEVTSKALISSHSSLESEFNKYSALIHILRGVEEFTLNGEGLIIGSNLEAVNVTGFEEYEVIGKHISILYAPGEQEQALADLEKARRLGNVFATGLRVKKRGVVFWAKMKIKFAPVNKGGPMFNVTLRDATHRALSNERFRNLREEYLAIFNNPFVGTFKFRMDGFRITRCNQKTREFFNCGSAKELSMDRFFASQQHFDFLVGRLKIDKRIDGFKFLTQLDNGQSRWIMLSARYFEYKGSVEGVLMDVTEQHQQMQELQRVNTELDNFVYHASHDLRAPLTSIMGLINLGLIETINAPTRNYLEMIRSRVDQLDFILRDLTSVSYNYSAEIQATPFNFKGEIQSILASLNACESTVKISVEIKQPYEFRTDPVRMRTILRNLISNSLQYYNPTITHPFIKLTIRAERSHCAIQLKDNGIGIHPQLKNRVYNMFFKATEKSMGSGLGLYIVKSMVDKLKGQISFESTLHSGTTFLITIPNEQSRKSINNHCTASSNYFMLTSRQIELVEHSWDHVLFNSCETGTVFYKKLFELDPQLRKMFNGDMKTQSEKLVAMITFAVHKLNHLADIISDIKDLGIKHKQNSVRIEHYTTVATALLWTLEKALGEQWNPEVKDAWVAVYTMLSETMIAAACEYDLSN